MGSERYVAVYFQSELYFICEAHSEGLEEFLDNAPLTGDVEIRDFLFDSTLPEFLVADPKSGKDPSKEKHLQRCAHDHWCHCCDAYRNMRRDSRRWVRHQAKAALLRGYWDDEALYVSKDRSVSGVVKA